MDAYCHSCGAEVEAYELVECVSCGEYFCEDCIDDGETCFACNTSEVEDVADEEENEEA